MPLVAVAADLQECHPLPVEGIPRGMGKEEFHLLLRAGSFVPWFFWTIDSILFKHPQCFQGSSSQIVGELETSSVLNIVDTPKQNMSWPGAGNEEMDISAEGLQFLLECRRKMGNVNH